MPLTRIPHQLNVGEARRNGSGTGMIDPNALAAAYVAAGYTVMPLGQFPAHQAGAKERGGSRHFHHLETLYLTPRARRRLPRHGRQHVVRAGPVVVRQLPADAAFVGCAGPPARRRRLRRGGAPPAGGDAVLRGCRRPARSQPAAAAHAPWGLLGRPGIGLSQVVDAWQRMSSSCAARRSVCAADLRARPAVGTSQGTLQAFLGRVPPRPRPSLCALPAMLRSSYAPALPALAFLAGRVAVRCAAVGAVALVALACSPLALLGTLLCAPPLLAAMLVRPSSRHAGMPDALIDGSRCSLHRCFIRLCSSSATSSCAC